MSENDRNATKEVAAGKKLKVAKKVAVVSLVSAAAVASVILIVGVNQQDDKSGRGTGDEGFVVELDNKTKPNHFMIATRPGNSAEPGEDVQVASDGSYVLVGEPLGNAWVTSSANIRNYYDGLLAQKGLSGGLSGSANYTDPDVDMPAGLLYTFYLNNVSTTETQTFRIAAQLTHSRGQNQEAGGVDVYEYLRLALFMGDDGQEDDDWRFFANKSMRSVALESDHTDFRECLSNWKWSDPTGVDVNKYRIPLYSDPKSNVSVCEYFTPSSDPGYADRGLFDLQNLEIKPGKSRRITFLAYLEGNDPDCIGEPPQNQRIGFSLHIGL